MAGCEHDAVRRLHRRHVSDAVLVAQRGSSVQPTMNIPPFLYETSTLLALRVPSSKKQSICEQHEHFHSPPFTSLWHAVCVERCDNAHVLLLKGGKMQ